MDNKFILYLNRFDNMLIIYQKMQLFYISSFLSSEHISDLYTVASQKYSKKVFIINLLLNISSQIILFLQSMRWRSTSSLCRAAVRTYIYDLDFHSVPVFVPQVLLSFFRSYFCSLRLLNSCDNVSYIFPMCVGGTQHTFLKWLVFMYTILNSQPSNTIFIHFTKHKVDVQGKKTTE